MGIFPCMCSHSIVCAVEKTSRTSEDSRITFEKMVGEMLIETGFLRMNRFGINLGVIFL